MENATFCAQEVLLLLLLLFLSILTIWKASGDHVYYSLYEVFLASALLEGPQEETNY